MPSFTERSDPQLAVAVPVSSCRCGPDCEAYDPYSVQMCNPDSCPILQIATDGCNQAELLELAGGLRPDIEMSVRAFHMKQALEQIGPNLARLDKYYCLSTVTLPYGLEEINEVDGDERDYRENIRCQIDLGVSAVAASNSCDDSLEGTARRALREYCRIDISADLWASEGQSRLRHRLEVDELPLQFWDSNTKVFVIILPTDAKITESYADEGLLCVKAPEPVAKQRPGAASVNAPTGSHTGHGGRTTEDWQSSQDEFKHLGRLPKPWIYVRSSRDKNVIYYLNTQTKATAAERPLPAGWTKQTSKSTGKTYYYNAALHKSLFDFPPPE